MSWAYWGIVTGLVVLVANFFLCLNLLYSDTKGPREGPREAAKQATGGLVEAPKQVSTTSRQAA